MPPSPLAITATTTTTTTTSATASLLTSALSSSSSAVVMSSSSSAAGMATGSSSVGKSWMTTLAKALVSVAPSVLPEAAVVSVGAPSSFTGGGTDASRSSGNVNVRLRMGFASGIPIIQRSNGGGVVSSKTCPPLAFLSPLNVAAAAAAAGGGVSKSTARTMSSVSTVAKAASLSSHSSDYSQQSSNPPQQQQQQQRTFSTSNNNKPTKKLSSSRSNLATSLLPSYLIDARAIQKYHPVSCPEGALQLSVAENQLSERVVRGVRGVVDGGSSGGGGGEDMTLVQVLSQLASSNTVRPSAAAAITATVDGSTTTDVFEKEMIYYQPTQGTPGLRSVMADYLQRLLVDPTYSNSQTTDTTTTTTTTPQMHPDGIVLGAGCNAVLENLCICLTEPGEGVMIPTPYYAAFEFDLVARAGCHIVPVNTFGHHQSLDGTVPIPPTLYYPNRSSLDHAYDRTVNETNSPPRVLLLSHPNNPLGICYPPEVMQECIDWCREKEVHLISDEIYAGSVYRSERGSGKGEGSGKPTFVSAMSLGANHQSTTVTSASGEESTPSNSGLGLGPYIHLVYALSKDFALSGLRVGVAYTENPEILFPMQKLNDLCQISSQTQLLVERMLSAKVVGDGERFVDVYLESNQANIRERCDELHQCLDEVGIPYLSADSGLFVWMDFREFLPPLVESGVESLESKERRERQLYLSLMKEYGLLFTPGMSMRNERAGFFRCVFTAASEEEFELGLARIRGFVEEQRSR
eukprot:g9149.t1 g9149   contig35:144349-146592(-)